jgi:hypothetical protein
MTGDRGSEVRFSSARASLIFAHGSPVVVCRLLVVATLTSIVAGCFRTGDVVTPTPSEQFDLSVDGRAVDLSTVEIGLERTESRGSQPSYEVVINGNGAVRYNGHSFVLAVGERTGSISPTQVRELLKRFIDERFFEMKPRYAQAITDMSTTFLTLRIGDRSSTVENYWQGDGRVDIRDKEIPHWREHQALSLLADTIDWVVDSEQWIGSEEDRSGRFPSLNMNYNAPERR